MFEQDIDVPVVLGNRPTGKTVKCYRKGIIYLPKDKIHIYGTGKVPFPEREELAQLKAERKTNQKAFSKDKAKQTRVEELEKKEHNYERSQGNLKSLKAAGLNPDSLEDELKIVSHLIEEAEKMGIELQIGVKKDCFSKIDTPNGKMGITSKWSVKQGLDGNLLVYLESVIYSAR
ncbi:MAG: hypothetical protein WCS37_11085 [Chloroflexota bacterium]|nr:hypothetical protein [Chloroflexota bacterium]